MVVVVVPCSGVAHINVAVLKSKSSMDIGGVISGFVQVTKLFCFIVAGLIIFKT